MISRTVHTINERIAAKAAGFPCLDGMQLFGLAEPVLRIREDGEEAFPAIINYNGEDTMLFTDDDYPAGLYHRLLSKTYSMAPTKQQYGDGNIQFAVADVILICWSFRNAIRTAPDVLESIIYSSFNEDVLVNQSNFDRLAVFNGEFSGVPFFLPETVMLFSMKYRIKQHAILRDCLNIGDICN
jgi:hypothetical protein